MAAAKAAIACALGHRTLVTPELVAVAGDTGYRVHSVAVPLAPLDPLLLADRLADFYGDAEFVVQDYVGLGDLGLGSLGASHLRMLDRLPVLLRPAGVPPVGAAEEVRDRGALAGWTRTVVAGYPFPEAGIASPGALLDPRVLATPGLRLLVRTEYSRPVAAGFAYDDRRSLGIYWLATLPARRRRGHGSALTAAAVGLAPQRPAVLSTTPAGLSVYLRLGFEVVGETTWWLGSTPRR